MDSCRITLMAATRTLPAPPTRWTPPERPIDWNDNVIPPMTHPSSSVWDQPELSKILIDDITATMSLGVFMQLKEYSATNPSGVYEGKMWKRHDGSFDHEFIARGGVPTWKLCWYGYSKIGLGYVSNNYRDIVLSDGELPK